MTQKNYKKKNNNKKKNQIKAHSNKSKKKD